MSKKKSAKTKKAAAVVEHSAPPPAPAVTATTEVVTNPLDPNALTPSTTSVLTDIVGDAADEAEAMTEFIAQEGNDGNAPAPDESDGDANATATDAVLDLLDRAASLLPPDQEIYQMVWQAEKQSKGHGADSDRELLLRCATTLRAFMGLSPTDALPYPAPPAPYPPSTHQPPIGHSLPGDSDR